MNITRNGKIARLPKVVREELNRRLSDGEPGKELVTWLNDLPEVQRIVTTEFGRRAVREQNLSEWKQGGYEEWLRQQEALELVRNLSAETDDLKAVTSEPLSENSDCGWRRAMQWRPGNWRMRITATWIGHGCASCAAT